MNCSFDVCSDLRIACNAICGHNCHCLQKCTSDPAYLAQYCVTATNTFLAGITVVSIVGGLAGVFILVLLVEAIRRSRTRMIAATQPPPYTVGSLPPYEDSPAASPPAYSPTTEPSQ